MIGNIGIPELLIILVIVLLLFGARKLPEIGQNLGKAIRSFRASSEAPPEPPPREIPPRSEEPATPAEKSTKAEEAEKIEVKR